MDDIHADFLYNGVIRFLTGDFPYCSEAIAVCMALQGAIAVRRGPNSQRKLHWFHAFILSSLAAFAGGTFNPIWMGSPSGVLSNDIFIVCAIASFVLVNYTPFDLGYKLLSTLPASIIVTSLAQLFRSLGSIKFLTACFLHFKESPSQYYPIPIFGPIIYGILLGNMGPLILKGLEAHIANGIPWAVQNGIFVCTFYHFYVHDDEGIIGNTLRRSLAMISSNFVDLDNKQFACTLVSLFMQIMGVLQMPQFLGPSFSPFGSEILSPFFDPSTWTVGKYEGAYAKQKVEQAGEAVTKEEGGTLPAAATKKKRKQKKKTS